MPPTEAGPVPVVVKADAVAPMTAATLVRHMLATRRRGIEVS